MHTRYCNVILYIEQHTLATTACMYIPTNHPAFSVKIPQKKTFIPVSGKIVTFFGEKTDQRAELQGNRHLPCSIVRL